MATPAAAIARERAGLGLDQVARRLGLSASYLARVEREGCCYGLAKRLASVYGCRLEVFLPTPGRVAPGGGAASPAGAAAGRGRRGVYR